MNNRKIIVLIVLGVMAVISLIYGILAPPHGQHRVLAESATVFKKKNIQRAQAAKIVPRKRRTKKTEFASWKRNPFVLNEKPAAPPLPELVLNGIVWYGDKPKAMINEEIVGVGDTIYSRKVVRIGENNVVISDGEKEYTLKME